MAYFDTKENSLEEAIRAAVKNEKLDAVNKTAVKKKFDDRKDKDIDNDGDVDSSDKYLHKRRKAISKAIKSEDADVNELSIADVKKATEKAKKRQEKERKATGRSGVNLFQDGSASFSARNIKEKILYALNNTVTMKKIADNAYDTLSNYIEKDVVLHKDVILDYFDKLNN